MGHHCQLVWNWVGKVRKMGWVSSMSSPIPPSWFGKVPTDQKSVVNCPFMERGNASGVEGGAR